MLRNRASLLLAALAACSSATQNHQGPLPARFSLCQHAYGSTGFLELDYVGATGLDRDYRGPILTCGDASDCISFPFAFAAPPRLPGQGETIRWSISGHDFAMTRLAGSPDNFQIRVIGDPRRGGGATRWENLYYTYNLHEGVTAYRDQEEPVIWARCAGRLTFEDLHRLRARLVPESRTGKGQYL